jgi:arginine repressor
MDYCQKLKFKVIRSKRKQIVVRRVDKKMRKRIIYKLPFSRGVRSKRKDNRYIKSVLVLIKKLLEVIALKKD